MTDFEVKNFGALPTGDANGLTHHASRLTDDPDRMRFAIVVFNVPKDERDRDKKVTILKPKVRRVELMTDPIDARDLERLALRAWERRNGGEMLPLELQKDLEDALDGLDPDAIAREEVALHEEGAEEAARKHMAARAAAEPEREETVNFDAACPSCAWPLATSPPGGDCATPEKHLNLSADDDPTEPDNGPAEPDSQ